MPKTKQGTVLRAGAGVGKAELGEPEQGSGERAKVEGRGGGRVARAAGRAQWWAFLSLCSSGHTSLHRPPLRGRGG